MLARAGPVTDVSFDRLHLQGTLALSRGGQVTGVAPVTIH
jgi:hypothetical protein